jgi:hypothetical protein
MEKCVLIKQKGLDELYKKSNENKSSQINIVIDLQKSFYYNNIDISTKGCITL